MSTTESVQRRLLELTEEMVQLLSTHQQGNTHSGQLVSMAHVEHSDDDDAYDSDGYDDEDRFTDSDIETEEADVGGSGFAIVIDSSSDSDGEYEPGIYHGPWRPHSGEQAWIEDEAYAEPNFPAPFLRLDNNFRQPVRVTTPSSNNQTLTMASPPPMSAPLPPMFTAAATAAAPGAVPRRSALQIVEHVLQFFPTLVDWISPAASSTAAAATTSATAAVGSSAPPKVTVVDSAALFTVGSAHPLSAAAPAAGGGRSLAEAKTAAAGAAVATMLDKAVVHNRTPLQLVMQGVAPIGTGAAHTNSLVVCMCDGDMPGAYWTLAGPAADQDEVDLMTSSSLFPMLNPTSLAQVSALPQSIQRATLVPDTFIFRTSEGSKLPTDSKQWHMCGVLLVPFLPNQYGLQVEGQPTQQQPTTGSPLTLQFKLMIAAAQKYKYDRLIIPLGRWARTNGNALEITLRLTQALEQMPDSDLAILIAAPPEQSHWQHSINSVIASAKVRRSEQRQTNPTASSSSSSTPAPAPTPAPSNKSATATATPAAAAPARRQATSRPPTSSSTRPSVLPFSERRRPNPFSNPAPAPVRPRARAQPSLAATTAPTSAAALALPARRPTAVPLPSASPFTAPTERSLPAASVARAGGDGSGLARPSTRVPGNNGSNGHSNSTPFTAPLIAGATGGRRRDRFRRADNVPDDSHLSASDRLWAAPSQLWHRLLGKSRSKRSSQ